MSCLMFHCQLFCTCHSFKSTFAHENPCKNLYCSKFANKNTSVCRDLTLLHLPQKHSVQEQRVFLWAGGPHPAAWRDVQRAEVQCQGGEVTEPCPSRYPNPGRAGTVCQHSGCGHLSQRLPPARGVTLPENAYEVPLRLTPSQRQADARTRKARPVPQWGI